MLRASGDINPDISRVGGFHRAGIQGRRRTLALQAFDNEAYGSLRRALRGNVFGVLSILPGDKLLPGPCCRNRS